MNRLLQWLQEPVGPGYEAQLDHLSGRLAGLNFAGRLDRARREMEGATASLRLLGARADEIARVYEATLARAFRPAITDSPTIVAVHY